MARAPPPCRRGRTPAAVAAQVANAGRTGGARSYFLAELGEALVETAEATGLSTRGSSRCATNRDAPTSKWYPSGRSRIPCTTRGQDFWLGVRGQTIDRRSATGMRCAEA